MLQNRQMRVQTFRTTRHTALVVTIGMMMMAMAVNPAGATHEYPHSVQRGKGGGILSTTPAFSCVATAEISLDPGDYDPLNLGPEPYAVLRIQGWGSNVGDLTNGVCFGGEPPSGGHVRIILYKDLGPLIVKVDDRTCTFLYCDKMVNVDTPGRYVAWANVYWNGSFTLLPPEAGSLGGICSHPTATTSFCQAGADLYL